MTCELHTQTWKDCEACQGGASRCQCGRIATFFIPEPHCIACMSKPPEPSQETLEDFASFVQPEVVVVPAPIPVKTDNHQQGWECPRCHIVHAPYIRSCECRP